MTNPEDDTAKKGNSGGTWRPCGKGGGLSRERSNRDKPQQRGRTKGSLLSFRPVRYGKQMRKAMAGFAERGAAGVERHTDKKTYAAILRQRRPSPKEEEGKALLISPRSGTEN